jgi:hypothetical protein
MIKIGIEGTLSYLLNNLHKEDKGIYKLFDKDKNLIYIGKSYSLKYRVYISSRYQLLADYVSIMILENKLDIDLFELKLIDKYNPIFNKFLTYNNYLLNNFKSTLIEENFSKLYSIDIEQIEIHPQFKLIKDPITKLINKNINTEQRIFKSIQNMNL